MIRFDQASTEITASLYLKNDFLLVIFFLYNFQELYD